MQLALEFFLVGKLASASQRTVLSSDMDGIGTRRLAAQRTSRQSSAGSTRRCNSRRKTFEIAFLVGGKIARHHAAFRSASALPNIMPSRIAAIDAPERISSRYQRPSAVSPNKTAPTSRPSEIDSLLEVPRARSEDSSCSVPD